MSEEQPSRRSVLRGIGAAGASIVGASGVASASGGESVAELTDQYDDQAAIERAIEDESDDVLAALANRGIISSPTPDVFDLGTEIEASRTGADDPVNGRFVTAYTDPNQGRTADIMVSKATPDHLLTLHVRPQADDSYALVVSRDTGEEFAIDPSAEQEKVPLDDSGAESTGLLAAGIDAVSAAFGLSGGLSSGLVAGDAPSVGTASSCDAYWTCTNDICRRGRTNSGGYRFVYTHLYMKCNASFDRCHCYVDKEQCDGVCDCVGHFCPG